MNLAAIDLSEVLLVDEIPGVYHARQKRSVRIRDSFIVCGIDALKTTRFSDLTIAQLALDSGNSVGAFYTRFQDKDAFFRALRAYTMQSLEREQLNTFQNEAHKDLPTDEVLYAMIDLMVDIFTSRFRGVLRESLLLILEPDDPWAPMRESALKIVATLQKSLAKAFPHQTAAQTNDRLRFCFQLVVGVLQNDLVNDYHVYTTRDDSLRQALKETVSAYMSIYQPAPSTSQ